MTIGHAQARSAHLAGVITLRLVMGLVVFGALGAGAVTWAATTLPADPLNRYPGFGFESSGVSRIPSAGRRCSRRTLSVTRRRAGRPSSA